MADSPTKLTPLAIWNRACSPGSESLCTPGDRALADMILVHSLIMNGGVHHALEALASDELIAGIGGYKYFNLTQVAAFVSSVRDDSIKAHLTEANELEANRRYHELVPDDEALVDAFSVVFRERPQEFE